MRVREIMEPVTAHSLYLSPDETIREAVNKLKSTKLAYYQAGVKGLPVMDRNGKLIGMVAIKDILRAVVPPYMTSALSDFTWEGWLENKVRQAADMKVSEIMTTHLVTIEEDAPLMECANLFLQYNLQRIPVLNKENKLVGVVYLRNIYHAIMSFLLDGEAGNDT
ncbi:MAG TPA: CBS domain-containing protein [Thermodesulfobacteriaceae bacterium]|nr:CBS domain-containing protein [Thermodesulfobacteriaceae bacterium]